MYDITDQAGNTVSLDIDNIESLQKNSAGDRYFACMASGKVYRLTADQFTAIKALKA